LTAAPELGAHACHCGNCRKWSGGKFLAVRCGTSVVFNQDAPLARYGSSDWAERVFCARCGSSLVWQMKDGSGQIVSIQAFESPGDFGIDLYPHAACAEGFVQCGHPGIEALPDGE
jgi:hypothetical protein